MDWETPPEVFEPLDAEFHFTLDVCATAENAKCARYFTEEEDGLAQDWDGVCWMNPPYGREILGWMKKAVEESRKGATVVCLVPSRTDTRWWHEYAMQADEIRYVKGRIRFVGAEHPAPFPSSVVVFRGEGWAQFACSDAQLKNGRWKEHCGIVRYEHTNIPVFMCSVCGDYFCDIVSKHADFYHYCPNCGAKMDGEAER